MKVQSATSAAAQFTASESDGKPLRQGRGVSGTGDKKLQKLEDQKVNVDSPVPGHIRARIDRWLRNNEGKLNRFGDPVGTSYKGKNPLLDEQSGKLVDRYVYILKQHPNLARGELIPGVNDTPTETPAIPIEPPVTSQTPTAPTEPVSIDCPCEHILPRESTIAEENLIRQIRSQIIELAIQVLAFLGLRRGRCR